MMKKIPETTFKSSPIEILWQAWARWLEGRREAELTRMQEQLNQAQWKNSLSTRAHESDLAAGYSLSHFNTMQ